jgi:hypothetical protein
VTGLRVRRSRDEVHHYRVIRSSIPVRDEVSGSHWGFCDEISARTVKIEACGEKVLGAYLPESTVYRKWARDYIHRAQTFVGAEEVEELTFLRDERRMLMKLIVEQKAENRRLRRQLARPKK